MKCSLECLFDEGPVLRAAVGVAFAISEPEVVSPKASANKPPAEEERGNIEIEGRTFIFREGH